MLRAFEEGEGKGPKGTRADMKRRHAVKQRLRQGAYDDAGQREERRLERMREVRGAFLKSDGDVIEGGEDVSLATATVSHRDELFLAMPSHLAPRSHPIMRCTHGAASLLLPTPPCSACSAGARAEPGLLSRHDGQDAEGGQGVRPDEAGGGGGHEAQGAWHGAAHGGQGECMRRV